MSTTGRPFQCSHFRSRVLSNQSQSVPIKMRSVLCGAVVLCLLQCCTAVPLEEFVGYPFSNETHQVYHIPPYNYYDYGFPVNISQPFFIDDRGVTEIWVSHILAVTFECMLLPTAAATVLQQHNSPRPTTTTASTPQTMPATGTGLGPGGLVLPFFSKTGE